MCYNIAGLALSKFKLAVRKRYDEKVIQDLWEEYERLRKIYAVPEYFANGWSKPNVLIQTELSTGQFMPVQWTFVPSHLKGTAGLEEFYRKRYSTLNARIEGLFSSPMYKEAARKTRGVIMLDGFYEYHHATKSKKVPFFIHRKDGAAMYLAGIWNSWVNYETGEELRSFAIVTTSPNEVMHDLHNNPKAKYGPRMPAILNDELAEQWLQPIENEKDQEIVKQSIIPYPSKELIYTPVGKLTGKDSTGNSKEAQEELVDSLVQQIEWLKSLS